MRRGGSPNHSADAGGWERESFERRLSADSDTSSVATPEEGELAVTRLNSARSVPSARARARAAHARTHARTHALALFTSVKNTRTLALLASVNLKRQVVCIGWAEHICVSILHCTRDISTTLYKDLFHVNEPRHTCPSLYHVRACPVPDQLFLSRPDS